MLKFLFIRSGLILTAFSVSVINPVNANLADAKPSAHWEENDFVVEWEVNGEPVYMDFVAVYDKTKSQFLSSCAVSGPVEEKEENGRRYTMGLNGVEYRCKNVQHKEDLIVTYQLTRFIDINLHYPSDFKKIDHIDPLNIDSEDWILSVMIDFPFYRQESNTRSSFAYNSNQYEFEFLNSEKSNQLFEEIMSSLSESPDRDVFELRKLSLLNHKQAQLEAYLIPLKNSGLNLRYTLDAFLAAKAGCNFSSAQFVSAQDVNFHSKYMNVERLLIPTLYGLTEEDISNSIEDWASGWRAVIKNLPNTRAATLADLQLRTHFQNFARSDTSPEYIRWNEYLKSLNLKHPYIGCEIPEFYLKATDDEFLKILGL